MTLKIMKKWSEIIKVIPHDAIPSDFDNEYKLALNLVKQNCCTQFNEGRLCTCSKRSNIGTRRIKEENYEMSDKLTLNPQTWTDIHVLKTMEESHSETAARENQCCWHGNNQRRKRSRSNTWSRQQRKSIMQWGCTSSSERIRNRRKKAERALVLTDSCLQ
jgi:hypothetical protein